MLHLLQGEVPLGANVQLPGADSDEIHPSSLA